MNRTCATFLVICLASAASAQDLPFPAAVTDRQEAPAGTLSLPVGRWTGDGGTPRRSFDGAVIQTAYRVPGPALSTLDLITPLQKALLAQGFVTLFSCEAADCGGFDFRYDLPLLAEPAMHVDLGDFRYFAATRLGNDGTQEAAMIVVSRSANAGFVQINRVGAPLGTQAPTLSTTSAPVVIASPLPEQVAAPAGTIGATLETGGSVALDDLVFPSGAASLMPGDYTSLRALATYLAANPARQIAIVGHTDASGGLEANIALSRRRAESVRRVLIDTLGAASAQVQAEGVGYLSPRASNLTDAGRTANRRVEVMLTSTE